MLLMVFDFSKIIMQQVKIKFNSQLVASLELILEGLLRVLGNKYSFLSLDDEKFDQIFLNTEFEKSQF